MKKVLLKRAALALLALALAACSNTTGGGEDIVPVPDDSIKIRTAEDMAKIGRDEGWESNGKYRLMNDITLADWEPIDLFDGSFDGGGKTITVQSFANASNGKCGIFYDITGVDSTDKALVKNLRIASQVSEVPSGVFKFGLLAGYAKNVEIDNITLSGTLSFAAASNADNTGGIGGIAGILNADAVIKNSNSALAITITSTGHITAGGFAGIFSASGGRIEKCHNTGAVSAANTATNNTNYRVMAGGIVNVAYSTGSAAGCAVSDCSSRGGITAIGSGSSMALNDSWAGGIAGNLINGLIERCFAAGTVTADRRNTYGYTYAGGIGGQITNGAIVSQCRFSGTVQAAAGGRAGGIAGIATSPSGTVTIEDCWSSGAVTCAENAGGIIESLASGTQAVTVKNCYSRAAVSSTGAGAAGGISGSGAASLSITKCVALNESVQAGTSANAHRVRGTGTATLTDNYGSNLLAPANNSGPLTFTGGADNADGEDCAAKPNQAFYQSLGWDFAAVWKMGNDGYPLLKWES
jgi:predicted small secreted protein